jgi:hypothetical protein
LLWTQDGIEMLEQVHLTHCILTLHLGQKCYGVTIAMLQNLLSSEASKIWTSSRNSNLRQQCNVATFEEQRLRTSEIWILSAQPSKSRKLKLNPQLRKWWRNSDARRTPRRIVSNTLLEWNEIPWRSKQAHKKKQFSSQLRWPSLYPPKYFQRGIQGNKTGYGHQDIKSRLNRRVWDSKSRTALEFICPTHT